MLRQQHVRVITTPRILLPCIYIVGAEKVGIGAILRQ